MIKTQGSPDEWIRDSENTRHKDQISELITVERFLASRGFEVEKEGNGMDTIIPKETWSFEEAMNVFWSLS